LMTSGPFEPPTTAISRNSSLISKAIAQDFNPAADRNANGRYHPSANFSAA
jgi:hypothetical protein